MKIKNSLSRVAFAVIFCAFFVISTHCRQGFGQEIRKMTRVLAPGVMKTIKPDFKFHETYTDGEIVEISSLGPEFNWAKLRFPTGEYANDRPVTCLEFQFKVPRILEVELPTLVEFPPLDGQLEKQFVSKISKTPVWYMIYSVTNKKWAAEDAQSLKDMQVNLLTSGELEKLAFDMEFGSTLSVEEFESGRFNAKAGESVINFVPQFIFASESLLFPKKKQYVVQEQEIPLALPAIIEQEDPNRTFETTVSMADRKIEPGETVWGIAMWTGIDPDVKDFSVYISGLSNACHWSIDKAQHKPGVVGSGYTMSRKTLKLNFWAPGGADHLLDKEIQYGTRAPAGRNKDLPPVDFEWVYR